METAVRSLAALRTADGVIQGVMVKGAVVGSPRATELHGTGSPERLRASPGVRDCVEGVGASALGQPAASGGVRRPGRGAPTASWRSAGEVSPHSALGFQGARRWNRGLRLISITGSSAHEALSLRHLLRWAEEQQQRSSSSSSSSALSRWVCPALLR